MNKSIKILFPVFFTFILFGCNKISTKDNYLKIDGKKYDLSSGFIQNYGLYDPSYEVEYDGYEIDLTLYEDGISLYKDTDGDISIDGKGKAIVFRIYSTEEYLAAGEYFFDYEKHEPGTFYYSDYYKINGEEYSDYVSLVTGSLKIEIKDNNLYSVIFDCMDENGLDVVGHYSGHLNYEEYAKKSELRK